ncbi:MAG: bifunctional adenosylcobinamide kinase/adenosylcobinamide-phosphate guanylyltransferase [Bacteroidetes bacterium]|nr:bifunctional adenosylcobinamide kinase/adenosylcobinamide-phosphate guanylyltransferase [Bacteroidota bacterium]
MHRIIFITGGARSGKSRYAQQKALELSQAPVYVATAKVYANDEEFKQRVNRHITDRDSRWKSIEEQFHVSKLPLENKVVVIDCVTLWLTNFFSLHKYDIEKSLEGFKKEIDALKKINTHFFIISNEIGMGVHAETEIGRKFTDLQGWANQYVAEAADEVVLMVSGIPMKVKERGTLNAER